MSEFEPQCTTCIQNKNNLVCLCQFVNVKFAIKVTNLTNIAPILCDQSNLNHLKKDQFFLEVPAVYIPIITNQSTPLEKDNKKITEINDGKDNLPLLPEIEKTTTGSNRNIDFGKEKKGGVIVVTDKSTEISTIQKYNGHENNSLLSNTRHTNITSDNISTDQTTETETSEPEHIVVTQYDNFQSKIHDDTTKTSEANITKYENTVAATIGKINNVHANSTANASEAGTFTPNISMFLPVNNSITERHTVSDPDVKLYYNFTNESDTIPTEPLSTEYSTKGKLHKKPEISDNGYANTDPKLDVLSDGDNATAHDNTSYALNNSNKKSKFLISDICNCTTTVTVNPYKFNNWIDSPMHNNYNNNNESNDNNNTNNNNNNKTTNDNLYHKIIINSNSVHFVTFVILIIGLLFILKCLIKKFKCVSRNTMPINDFNTNSYNTATINRNKNKKNNHSDFNLNGSSIIILDYNNEASNATINDMYHESSNSDNTKHSAIEADYPLYENIATHSTPNTKYEAHVKIFKDRDDEQQPTFKCQYNPESQKFLTYPNKLNMYDNCTPARINKKYEK